VRRYLYFAVFTSGLVTLTVELTASRLLGSYFGSSNLVWASIIGLMLIYLTFGYTLGGRLGDRQPYERTLYSVMLAGGALVTLVPTAALPILRAAANAFDQLQMGDLLGSFVVVMVLFILPITLLGMVSPIAVRLAITTPLEAGRISGRVSSMSTFGSFIGTFLPVLVLIPVLGTEMTFVASGLALMAVALIGFGISQGWRTAAVWSWIPLVTVGLFLALGGGPFKVTPGQVYEIESAYNYIEVVELDGYTMLRLNDGQGVHSMYHPTDLDYDGPWEQFLAASFFFPDMQTEDVERIAIIGLAAGTTARQATAVFGSIPIDGYEIDPEIIAVGRRYFGMTMENLNAYAMDGRWGLYTSDELYSIIAIDAYRPPYIPWHLTTQEFFLLVRDHLTETGTVVINVGRAPEDRSLIDAMVTTLQTVFPSVHVMDIPYTLNTMVYATVSETGMDDFIQNYLELQADPTTHPLLLDAMALVIVNQQPLPEPSIVFTDDKAPVEWVVNRMVLEFMLSGDIEVLR
jgi:spermidine synthase